MKPWIQTLYNGKQFKSLINSGIPDVDKLVIQTMGESLEASLTPLKSKIEDEGGQVQIDIKGPASFEYGISGLSDELKQKIRKALTPAD
jgi:hypothetical protein